MFDASQRIVKFCALTCLVASAAACTGIDEETVSTTEQEVAVVWQNVVGANAVGNNLTKTAADGWGNSGASSTQSITGDGFAEFTTAETNRGKAFGLSFGDTTQSFNDIDFAFQPDSSGRVFIYEAAVAGGTSSLVGQFGTYVAGDVFRLDVVGNVVSYRKNGVLLRTSPRIPRFPLLVDAAMFHNGATIQNVQISEAADAVFTNKVGVDVLSTTSLRKTVGLADQWGNSGAITVRTIKADTGFLEFRGGETTHGKVAGLSNVDTNQNINSVRFGIFLPRLSPNGRVQVFENNVIRFTDSVNWAVSDVFRVEVVIGANNVSQVQYKKNGAVLFTSAQAVTYPLFGDFAFFHDGGTLTNIVLDDTFFTNVVGANADGNNLFSSTTTTGFGASGAVSIRALSAGDGFMEFRTGELNSAKAAGLSNGDSNQNATDIDFAIVLGANNSVSVMEGGVTRGTFGTYSTSDVYRVQVTNNVVTYLRNGVVFFTSTGIPTFPLLVDTAVSVNATIRNVVLTQTAINDGVPRDPVSGFGVPVTQADWNLVFSAAGVTPKTVNQSWGLQDAAGDAAAVIGEPMLASTGLLYRQPVTGWDRDAIMFAPDGAAEFLFQRRTTAPDPTLESVLSFAYIGVDPTASTRRLLVIAGGGEGPILLSMVGSTFRLVCATVATLGTSTTGAGPVRPLVLQYNRTAAQVRAYTDQEIISGTFTTAVVNSTRGLGTAANSGTTGVQRSLLAAQFRGANAEWTEAEMRAVYNVLIPGSVPW